MSGERQDTDEMVGYEEDAESFHRPLFVEPPDDIQRESEWDGPKGFLVGGWANFSREQLAQQYLASAKFLSEAIEQNRAADYEIGFPVLYLYRHMIELFLKGALDDPPRTHNLKNLLEAFCARVEAKLNVEVPGWFRAYVLQIDEMDPDAMAFRFSEKKPVKRRTKSSNSSDFDSLPGEYWVDLVYLNRVMELLASNFARVITAVGEKR